MVGCVALPPSYTPDSYANHALASTLMATGPTVPTAASSGAYALVGSETMPVTFARSAFGIILPSAPTALHSKPLPAMLWYGYSHSDVMPPSAFRRA